MLSNEKTTSGALGTISIWIAIAVILTFGVFRINWTGDIAMMVMLMAVGIICGAGTISTVAIWGSLGRKNQPAEKAAGP